MPRTARAPLLGAVLCAAALVAGWALTFHVAAGRWLDSSVLEGFTALNRPSTRGLADGVAHLVDPVSFVLLGAALVVIALVRGRPRLAAAVVVVLAGASVTTQFLKPALADPRIAGWLGQQIHPASWPSGHATAAMSLALCAVLVAPPRVRPLAAAAGGAFAVAVSFAVLVIAWHYPSDVLGGFLVAALWTLLAVAALRAADARWPARTGREAAVRVTSTFAPAIVAALAAGAVAAGAALARPAAAVDFADAHTTFFAGAAAIVALGGALVCGLAAALRSS
jgi:membrane-associated phospholipid phosphatase